MTDIEIAQSATPKNITEIAKTAGIDEKYLECYGRYKAKIDLSLLKENQNEDGKLIWRCPKCGNEDQDKMNVARRTCGYIGTQFWNQGRTQEIKERVLHL